MNKGVLVVVSGFSGAGKGTIMKALLEKYDEYAFSISATTRQPRLGEQEGVEYFFKTRDEFEVMIKQNELVEWAEYVGNYYGTPKSYVEACLKEGKNVLLEIEMQGGMLVKEKYPDAVLVFITTPSAEMLHRRLAGRGTENSGVIRKRMLRASQEADYMKQYDYIVVNDVLEEAVVQVHTIIQSEKRKTKYCIPFINQIKQELLDLKKGYE